MLFPLLIASWASAAPGYLRTPDLHGNHVVFSAEGDLWRARVDGGRATRLTRSPGIESRPRISPDGTKVAFEGTYDGNREVYIVDVDGGEPRRITWHPTVDQPVTWLDDDTLVFRSLRSHPLGRNTELFRVSARGGAPERLPVGHATLLGVDPESGQWAFNRRGEEIAHWKRYRGGTARDLWVGHPKKADFRKVTDFDGMDAYPMWHDGRIYFVSDQGGTQNLWSMAPDGSDRTQHTTHTEWDARFPELGDEGRIVYMLAGDLHIYDIAEGTDRALEIDLPSDRIRTRTRYPNPTRGFRWASISPDGERVLYNTRGEIFSVPVEDGVTLPITAGSGSRESWGAFSPDGKRVVYVTDDGGEESIRTRDAWGRGTPRVVVPAGNTGWHFPPRYSPNGQFIAYSDHEQALYVAAADGSSPPRQVAQSQEWEIETYVWSPDSRWLAYTQYERTGYQSVWVWDRRTGTSRRVTSPTTNDHTPAWDPKGRYLYFLGERHVSPVFGRREFRDVLLNTTRPYAILLRPNVDVPFMDKAGAPPPVAPPETRKQRKRRTRKKKLGIEGDDASAKAVTIDFDGIEDRTVRFPVDHGNYWGLAAGATKVFFAKSPIRGRNDEIKDAPNGGQLLAFDLEEETSKVVHADVIGFELSRDGETLLLRHHGNTLTVTDGNEAPEPVDLSGVVVELDPREEWAQMYQEGWRVMRDFYWDERMAGVDWDGERKKYATLLPRLATREDLRDVLAQLIGELGTSHTYVWGGDTAGGPWVPVGLLGADLERVPQGYRIGRIYQGEAADEVVSPLAAPGVGLKEGDYILRVNHQPFRDDAPYTALLHGLAGKPVLLTVNSTPSLRGARNVVVTPLGGEGSLRYADWVRRNRAYVAEKSGGKFGYIHIPDMGTRGLVMFDRWFYPQLDKEGMVVDVRWNGGGNVSQLILERFRRKVVGFVRPRHGGVGTYPGALLNGPFVVLLNEFAGSDGDIFPAGVQEEGLAPVIGTRSWGGVIGIRADKPMTDGGMMTQPEFAYWWPERGWGVENYGVDPDIEIDNQPQDIARGVDAQLDRGHRGARGTSREAAPGQAGLRTGGRHVTRGVRRGMTGLPARRSS